ncbi:DNA excision repair protein ERCC-5 [Drosophila nasuta]|uniref:DNA excision repair protein ERCC-5 n=1 Tax=Drosophila nasuta TaxID=42062 RepID=UPI00295EBCFA|nr:DNA excision repair protein ERCC-5 [Drosophila nasuta]
MGVTGLWKLIEPCGKPVPVETLEGKVLAVDISIWLHQVVKGFQDNKGSALNNAHLLGLFHRLCKLLYYRVRPVFIFDGCVPQLKRDTIARRQQQRSKLSNEADRIQALLLQSLAKEKVVQQALGTNAELLLKSPTKRPAAAKSGKTDEDDIFKLPELPASAAQFNEADSELEDQEYASTSATSDSSFDETTARHTYNSSLQAIDVRSQHFKNLPADVRHEILTDIKETRKQSSWGRLHELPARSDDFCSFQMKRLLKRRAVQESLEQAEQEMGGRTLTYSELSEFFSEEGIVTPTAIEESTRQISSDEHTRFLLVRDLKKKALEDNQKAMKIKCEPIKELDSEEAADEKPSTSAMAVKRSIEDDDVVKKELGSEYDTDLAMALALSLEESGKVYDEKDYDYDSDQDLRLNREQSKQLRHAAKGPARAYMIEYGGMNEEEVGNIMEATQLNDTQSLEAFLHNTNVNTETAGDEADNSIEEAKLLSLAIEESKRTHAEDLVKSEQIQTIDSDTDSDLEEVVDTSVISSKKSLEICVDIKDALNKDDDLFADIFDIDTQQNKECSKNSELQKTEIADKELEETLSKDAMSKKIIPSKQTAEEIVLTDSEKQIESEDELCDAEKTSESDLKTTVAVAKEKERPSGTDLKPLPIKPAAALDSLLDDLKRQTADVKNIKLESIKLGTSAVIELSSDDEASKAIIPSISKDIIELCDSENETEKKRSSPNKTPSKSKAITDYFETSYKIKRTPDKPIEADVTPPSTPKPFYIKRTPKSSRKRNGNVLSDEGISPNKKSSKAAKSLFPTKEPEKVEPVNTQDLINDAADALKSQKSNEELQAMASNLAQERRDLEVERNRQDRMGMSISQRMSNDCQELLRLFGIPYIVAPMEAEAQCAFLNAVELTNGTITDDSDIWLFGGRTVYKNFFAQNKHVLEFRAEQIEQTFNCNRGKLIQLACLVGSDYTTGIHGIGAVTALEILASFSSTTHMETTPSVSLQSSVLSTLVRFRDWWQAHKNSNLPIGSSARLSLRKKLKNIELHEGFPSSSVVDAYLSPTIDDNRDAFSWGSPDVESIREFTRKSFGWTTSKTDDILMPVMKKINEKKIQGSIRNYFTAKSALRVQQPPLVSKRVQIAIDKMSGKIDNETPEKPKRAPRRGRKKATEDQEASATEESADCQRNSARPKRGKRKSGETTNTACPENPSTSNETSKPAKCARIPSTREVIPQRERDMEQMRQNKVKAAEVLKANAKAASKKI